MPEPVIIVGGGIAGIAAALHLLDNQQPVVLLDRDGAEAFGGLAQWSFGGFFLVNSPQQRKLGIRDSAELALSDWMATAAFGPEDHWPRQWAEAYVTHCQQEVGQWLTRQGLSFLPAVQWIERGRFGPGNSVPRFHMVWGLGRGLTDTLTSRLLHHPQRAMLELRFRARVTGLIRTGGAVTGVVGVSENENEPFAVEGAAVVIAAGGLTGDMDMMRRHWNPALGAFPSTLLSGTHPYADGASYELARQAGGRLLRLDHQWCYAAGVQHPQARFSWHGLSLVPPKSALWVNYRGERIGPEPLITGFDTRYLVEKVAAQDRPYSWQVLNRRIAVKELAVSGSQYNDALVNQDKLAFARSLLLGNADLVDELTATCPDFVTADTLDQLTARMNALQGDEAVSLPVLKAALTRWDTQVRLPRKLQNDDQLRRIDHARAYLGDRLRTCYRQPILDPKAGPLLAIRLRLLVRKTLGGIVTDLDCRALNEAGDPIPGLYAIGEAAGYGGGGYHGHAALEGTFLGGCIYTARRLAAALG